MRLLLYKDLDLRRVKTAFQKVRHAIEAGDFRTPSIKKLHGTPFWRAKLGGADRLLLQFVPVGGQTVCWALEVILATLTSIRASCAAPRWTKPALSRSPTPNPPTRPFSPPPKQVPSPSTVCRPCAGSIPSTTSSSCSTNPEVSSAYQTSSQLRVRASNGHYFPNPDMRVRVPRAAGGTDGIQWQAMG